VNTTFKEILKWLVSGAVSGTVIVGVLWIMLFATEAFFIVLIATIVVWSIVSLASTIKNNLLP